MIQLLLSELIPVKISFVLVQRGIDVFSVIVRKSLLPVDKRIGKPKTGKVPPFHSSISGQLGRGNRDQLVPGV